MSEDVAVALIVIVYLFGMLGLALYELIRRVR